MLTQIRERATGWLAWVIVILITIPFALWGIQSYFGNPAEAPIATVNGEEIPLYSYLNELSRRRQALLSEGAIDPALLESPALRNEVMESMIATRLVSQYVRERDYRLSDARLKQRIESTPAFLRDGRFDPALYRDLLRSNGFSPQSYEAQERQNGAIGQLAAALGDTAFATEYEVNRLLRLQLQTRQADYAILPAQRFEDEFEISDEEAEQHYNDNLPQFEAAARIKVDYIELSVADLATGIEPTDAEISETYDNTSGRYKQPETRKASHILFAVAASADDSARDEALAAAEAVLVEARGGADFAELAAEHSDDPGSKERGGDLGVVARGQMVEPFEEAVFDMAENEIRGPIETRFGYHLIQLTELQPERQKPLDEVREEVAEEARRAQAETLFAELGETFENLVFEDPESLTNAAAQLGLEVEQTDWFTQQSGEGLADDVRVRRAAFSEDVLTDDLNSAAIELGFDRLVAVRKHDYEAARTRTFDEVRDDIIAGLKLQKSANKAQEQGAQLVADLSAGEGDWSALLSARELQSEALAETRDLVPDDLAPLGDAVFTRAAPEPGAAVYDGVALGNGDYAVYALNQVTPGDLGDIDEFERLLVQQQLRGRDGEGLYQQLLRTIRQHAEVAIDRGTVEDPASVIGYQ